MTAFDDAYKQYTVDTEDACPVNPDRLAAVEDNTELMYLHDPSLLRNVEQRYNQHDIYTYTAFILIAVNPYAHIPPLPPPAFVGRRARSPHILAVLWC